MRAAAVLLAAVLITLPPAAASPAHASSPGPPTARSAWIARLVAPTPAWPAPRAAGRPRMLSPLGRWTGGPVGLLVLAARHDTHGREWLRVLLPVRPNGTVAWIAAARVSLVRTRWRVRVDVASRRVTVLRAGRVVRRFAAVVGAPGTPTPRGRFAVYEIAAQPDPAGFLGPWALHLTAHSDVLDDYGGGPGRVALHGRGGASLADPLGSARSHGCVRVANPDIAFLARMLAPGAPVTVT